MKDSLNKNGEILKQIYKGESIFIIGKQQYHKTGQNKTNRKEAKKGDVIVHK